MHSRNCSSAIVLKRNLQSLWFFRTSCRGRLTHALSPHHHIHFLPLFSEKLITCIASQSRNTCLHYLLAQELLPRQAESRQAILAVIVKHNRSTNQQPMRKALLKCTTQHNKCNSHLKSQVWNKSCSAKNIIQSEKISEWLLLPAGPIRTNLSLVCDIRYLPARRK